MVLSIAIVAALLTLLSQTFADDVMSHKSVHPEAVAEVESGYRDEANAAWWGFDPVDATEILQKAINSKAKRIVVPYMGSPWIIRPVKLRADLELVFEPGVLVLAKRGEFKGRGDSLFTADRVENVTIRGYGATLRMWKKDYQTSAYAKAEWRMGLRIVGCKNVLIEGLRIESSGGDGIYIGPSGEKLFCEDVEVRNCVCDDNHRQGMSVISAENLLVENCVFSRTKGTPPEAGIDLEPDDPRERLVNCVIRNSVFENNAGHAILVYPKQLNRQSESVSIRFENCVSRMGKPGMLPDDFKELDLGGWSGMAVGASRDDGPAGLIEFLNCTAENTGRQGASIFDKSAIGVKVRFVNCNFRSGWVSRHREYGGPRSPIFIHSRRPKLSERLGGIEFVDCHIYEDIFGPAVRYEQDKPGPRLMGVTGKITVHSPHRVWGHWGAENSPPDLQLIDAKELASP